MRGLLVAALVLALAEPLAAQHATRSFAAPPDSTRVVKSGWSPIRIAKWSTLLISAGAAAYGFRENREADNEYESIEAVCVATPDACQTTSTGSYSDLVLEQRYQEVVRRDDKARTALLLGQVGLAASVLLFILDLPENTATDDIPYDPRALGIRIVPAHNGLSLRVPVP